LISFRVRFLSSIFRFEKSKNEDIQNYKLAFFLEGGCENKCVILREERRLRVFEDRVLREIFGSKRDEVSGEWRKLHSNNLVMFVHHQKVFG
jgi:hypothetical protein